MGRKGAGNADEQTHHSRAQGSHDADLKHRPIPDLLRRSYQCHGRHCDVAWTDTPSARVNLPTSLTAKSPLC
jgi:hypothetical protein